MLYTGFDLCMHSSQLKYRDDKSYQYPKWQKQQQCNNPLIGIPGLHHFGVIVVESFRYDIPY